MSHKKYLLLLITLLLIASCGKKEIPIDEITTEVEKVVEAVENNTGNTQEEIPQRDDLATPIPVSTKTEEGIQTKFVEPTPTKFDTKVEVPKTSPTPPVSVVSPKVVRLEQTYKSPAGDDTVAFNISIKDAKITAITTQTIKAHKVSTEYQAKFSAAIGSQIIGKTIEEAKNIGVIAGASLTTGAFKTALKNM